MMDEYGLCFKRLYQILPHISLIFYMIWPDWVLIDLVFNSELAGIDDHVLDIVSPQCQWNMVSCPFER